MESNFGRVAVKKAQLITSLNNYKKEFFQKFAAYDVFTLRAQYNNEQGI